MGLELDSLMQNGSQLSENVTAEAAPTISAMGMGETAIPVAGMPTEVPVETPAEMPAEMPAEVPAEMSAEGPLSLGFDVNASSDVAPSIPNVMTQADSVEEENTPAAFVPNKEEPAVTDDILAKIEEEIAKKKELIARIESALREKDELDAKLNELAERANGKHM